MRVSHDWIQGQLEPRPSDRWRADPPLRPRADDDRTRPRHRGPASRVLHHARRRDAVRVVDDEGELGSHDFGPRQGTCRDWYEFSTPSETIVPGRPQFSLRHRSHRVRRSGPVRSRRGRCEKRSRVGALCRHPRTESAADFVAKTRHLRPQLGGAGLAMSVRCVRTWRFPPRSHGSREPSPCRFSTGYRGLGSFFLAPRPHGSLENSRGCSPNDLDSVSPRPIRHRGSSKS